MVRTKLRSHRTKYEKQALINQLTAEFEVYKIGFGKINVIVKN